MGVGVGRTSRGALIPAAVILLGILVGACSPPGAPPAPATAPTPTPRAASSPPPSGPVAQLRPVHYVALGDSLASGINGQPSYVDHYARLLRQGTPRGVRLTNLGRPAWTSSQLLDALRSNDRFRSAVKSADVITWDIGGNDILQAALRSAAGICDDARRCLRDARTSFVANWDGIVDELVSLRAAPSVRLQTFDLYTPFVTLPGVPRDVALEELAVMNAAIRASDGRHGIEVAGVKEAFGAPAADDLIAADGVHPTAAGHRLIARLLAQDSRTAPD